MKRIIVIATVLVLAFTAAAVAKSPITKTDRTNAARACTSLRTSLGPTKFSLTYATMGACTSQWVLKANAARNAALTTCKAKGLSAKALAACTKSHTASTLAATESAVKSAAKACASQLTSNGASVFEKTWGANHNLRNAFGKCVSWNAKHPNGPTTPTTTTSPTTGAPSSAQHFSVVLSSLNGSGVSGTGSLLLNHSDLTVKLDIAGLQSGQTHSIAIRGLSSGTATCPTASADTNNDGTISLSEGQAFFGSELLVLDQSAQPQSVSSSVLPLTTRTIVVLGGTVKGTYDPTLPVACSVITS